MQLLVLMKQDVLIMVGTNAAHAMLSKSAHAAESVMLLLSAPHPFCTKHGFVFLL